MKAEAPLTAPINALMDIAISPLMRDRSCNSTPHAHNDLFQPCVENSDSGGVFSPLELSACETNQGDRSARPIGVLSEKTTMSQILSSISLFGLRERIRRSEKDARKLVFSSSARR
jgi:hypothetical protein